MKETNGVLWDPSGPRLAITNRGDGGPYSHVLNIQDLNPHRDFSWAFSRWDMARIGIWFIKRAIFARASAPSPKGLKEDQHG